MLDKYKLAYVPVFQKNYFFRRVLAAVKKWPLPPLLITPELR